MRVSERSRRGLLLALLLLTAGSACGVRKELAVAAEVRSDIQRELRVDANVNVNEFRGNLVLTITLQARPSGDLDVARERAVAIARARLPEATRIDVFTRL
jgi:hypothetical protein